MTRIIAEFKRSSPWAGSITERPLEEVVEEYDRDPEIWGVSIVADQAWDGSLVDVEVARRYTKKPILAKGLDLCPQHALKAGANFSLTYDWLRATEYPGTAWLEVHEPEELPPVYDGLVIVANNRNIKTGELVPDAAVAVKQRLRHSTPSGIMLCAASGYEGPDDIPLGFDFGLIGTAFL